MGSSAAETIRQPRDRLRGRPRAVLALARTRCGSGIQKRPLVPALYRGKGLPKAPIVAHSVRTGKGSKGPTAALPTMHDCHQALDWARGATPATSSKLRQLRVPATIFICSAKSSGLPAGAFASAHPESLRISASSPRTSTLRRQCGLDLKEPLRNALVIRHKTIERPELSAWAEARRLSRP
jgi:hypothetical protein